MKTYKTRGRDMTSFSELADWLKNGEAIKGSSMRGESGNPVGLGVLPEDWQRTVTARRALIDYTVYSYATPIAWHDVEAGWIQPDEKYSVTTSKVQGKVAAALSVLGR